MKQIAQPVLLAAAVVFALATARADTHYHWSDGFSRMDLEIRGSVEFTDNDADVKSLSADGYFRLEQWGAGVTRVYAVRPGSSNNTLDRVYSVDGAFKALDADGRAWLSRTLPQVIRESAIGAADRVRRILGQQGPNGVFTEIGKIESDHARRIYLQALLEYGNLKAEHLRESMRLARKIGSDGEKATLLITVAPHYHMDSAREAYFDAIDSISSDGEHRRVLNAVLDRYGPDHEVLASTLRSAKRISSDGEKASVLVHVADFRLADQAVRLNYFRSADSLSSDGEHRRVLVSVLKKNSADRDIVVRALRSASDIGSDGEKAAVLVTAAADYAEDPGVRRAFFDAAATLSSDGERSRVLMTLLHSSSAGKESVIEIIRSAEKMSSDGEKARVFSRVAQDHANEPQIASAIRSAVKSIQSDGEYRRVMSMLTRSE